MFSEQEGESQREGKEREGKERERERKNKDKEGDELRDIQSTTQTDREI